MSKTRPPLTFFHGMVTVAPVMRDMFDLVRRVARTDAAILIRGETGTGKELVARALHDLSPRGRGPFLAINCATLTPELLASELFGHARGAFTGAIRDHKGLFERADGGTVFLDEIAEISNDIQARLLRVLQDQTFVPLGAVEPVRADVRIVSATHKALRREVDEGRFRADLMYRIRVVPLFLPPLRDRVGDVEALTWHFVEEINRDGHRLVEEIEDAALEALLAHDWPGNVRELRNVVQYAFAVGEGPALRVSELPPELRGEAPLPNRRSDPTIDSPMARERVRILDALDRAQGKKAEAAALLGMSRSTLWRKMREHGI